MFLEILNWNALKMEDWPTVYSYGRYILPIVIGVLLVGLLGLIANQNNGKKFAVFLNILLGIVFLAGTTYTFYLRWEVGLLWSGGTLIHAIMFVPIIIFGIMAYALTKKGHPA